MGNIYHEWNGTVLTVTSDSGTSSADLKGDMGVRGPQGVAGKTGNVNYKVLEDYATQEFVTNKIAEAQIPEKEVDLSGYYAKSEANSIFANALKGNKSGSAILIDDVSPITHNMGVKISSVQKNLLSRLIAKAYNSSDMEVPTEDFINTYCSKKISFKQGTTYTFSIKSVSGFSGDVAWQPSFYIFDNGSLFVSNATSPPVTFSTDFFTSDSNPNEYICYKNKALWTKNNMIQNSGPWTMTITPVKDFEAVFIVTSGNVTDSVTVTEAQIEVGSTATSYVPYIENPITDLTTVTVRKQGKNLFDKNNSHTLNGYLSGNTITANNNCRTIYIPCLPNTTYTVSKIQSSRFAVAFAEETPAIGSTVHEIIRSDASTSITATSSTNDNYIAVWIFHGKYDTTITLNEILSNLQIELGTTATDYEPYITTIDYAPNADGTVNGVTSLYPNTSLMTDTNGVLIDCEYNRDINKAFAELQQAIISLGGNV